MEFLVAFAVCEDLLHCVKKPNLGLDSLVSLVENHPTGTSLQECVAAALKESSTGEGTDTKPAAAAVRRIVNAIREMAENLGQGSLGTVDLAAEAGTHPPTHHTSYPKTWFWDPKTASSLPPPDT